MVMMVRGREEKREEERVRCIVVVSQKGKREGRVNGSRPGPSLGLDSAIHQWLINNQRDLPGINRE